MPPRKKKDVQEVVEEVAPKKRERKSGKHQVVAVVTQDGIQGMFTPELRRPLIAHLPIHSSEVEFYDQIPKYDPNPPANPVAYEDSMTNPFIELNEDQAHLLNSEKAVAEEVVKEPSVATARKAHVVQQQPVVQTSSAPVEYGPSKLLVSFSASSETKELPSSTSVACFWCCEVFQGRPCVLPNFVSDSVWHVYGNFCTPQCASAYLLNEQLDTHVRWNRLALLHRLYAASCGGRVYPAPHRECLERFGGPMKTQDFRTLCEQRKVRADVHLPPMVSILASMDTKPIDFYETSLRNTTATTHSLPVQEGSSLKLKRTKPLKDRESTLDMCLNIRVRSNDS